MSETIPPPMPESNPVLPDLDHLPDSDLTAHLPTENVSNAALVVTKPVPRFTIPTGTPFGSATSQSALYRTLILQTATHYPFRHLTYPTISTYVPDTTTVFIILNSMDQLMASAKRWIDNSAGWVPPISQAYIATLIYQIMKAQSITGNATSATESLLARFERTFPTSEIWIRVPPEVNVIF